MNPIGSRSQFVHPREDRHIWPAICIVGDWPDAVGKDIVIVLKKHIQSQAHLTLIVHAAHSLDRCFRCLETWQQHRNQDGNDADHDQEFDKRERRMLCVSHEVSPLSFESTNPMPLEVRH